MKWTWVRWTWPEWHDTETGTSVPHLLTAPTAVKTACGLHCGPITEREQTFSPPEGACERCRRAWRAEK